MSITRTISAPAVYGKGWKLDKKLTSMMVEDMLFDPILAAKVLLRVKLPPHEELRVLWMWTTYYTNDDSGFSTGKSWTFALISALRSILMPQRISGILSKTFSQGKLIFKNFDRWHDTCPIFRSCIKYQQGKPRLVHGGDVWEAYFRGGSQIRVIPPNFLQDAERIRSERWHDGYFDEWTTYGNFTALNRTIIGRVTNINEFSECPVRQNHIHLASTPAFKHHPAYRMVRTVDYQIAIGNKDYGRFTVNYRHIPKKPQWNWLVNRKTIFHMQTNLPRGIVKSEIDGIWSDDSQGYYSSATVEPCRFKNIPLLMQRTSPTEIFIAGFDVARGGNDNTSKNQGDDFSLSVLRCIDSLKHPHHVLTVRKSGISAEQMSAIIHKFHILFGFVCIVFDPGGGGLFVQDKLRSREQLIDNDKHICTPIVTHTDTTGTLGFSILVPFRRGGLVIDRMWGKMASDSVLVNKAHQTFQEAIQNKKVGLAPTWSGWDENFASWDVSAKREWLNRHGGLTEQQRYDAERDLAVNQLIMVDYERDKDGAAVIDAFGMYKFKSKYKKDSAYSLMYSYIAYKAAQWMADNGMSSLRSADKNSVTCYMEPI